MDMYGPCLSGSKKVPAHLDLRRKGFYKEQRHTCLCVLAGEGANLHRDR